MAVFYHVRIESVHGLNQADRAVAQDVFVVNQPGQADDHSAHHVFHEGRVLHDQLVPQRAVAAGEVIVPAGLNFSSLHLPLLPLRNLNA